MSRPLIERYRRYYPQRHAGISQNRPDDCPILSGRSAFPVLVLAVSTDDRINEGKSSYPAITTPSQFVARSVRHSACQDPAGFQSWDNGAVIVVRRRGRMQPRPHGLTGQWRRHELPCSLEWAGNRQRMLPLPGPFAQSLTNARRSALISSGCVAKGACERPG